MNEELKEVLKTVLLIFWMIAIIVVLLRLTLRVSQEPETEEHYRFYKWEGKIESWEDDWVTFEDGSSFSYDKVLDEVEQKTGEADVWILDKYYGSRKKMPEKRLVVKVEYKRENEGSAK